MSLGPDIERIRTWSVRTAERAFYVSLRFDAAIELLLVEHGDCFAGFDAGVALAERAGETAHFRQGQVEDATSNLRAGSTNLKTIEKNLADVDEQLRRRGYWRMKLRHAAALALDLLESRTLLNVGRVGASRQCCAQPSYDR